MNMVSSKQICIALTIAVFVLNADANWTIQCFYQLIVIGKFTINQTKTDAFMHAFKNLVIPKVNEVDWENEGILYSYQKELLDEYIEANEKNLHFMFQNPITWCKQNIRRYINENNLSSIDEQCKNFFQKTHKGALTYAFSNIRYNDNTLNVTNIFADYYRIIEGCIEEFVEYTYARNPLDFCYKKESLPEFFVTLNENKTVINDYNSRPRIPGSALHPAESVHSNIIETPASSSGRVKNKGLNIDLNKLATDEDE